MATIQGVYIALFGRPADPTGLAYFNGLTNNGADLSKIANLAGQPEYTSRFAGKSATDIVINIYQSLFGRPPEQAGLSFFVGELASGRLNINNVAIAILDGAQGNDKAVIANKLVAADAFTKAIDTPQEIAAYRGDAAAAAAQSFLTPIGSNTATIPTQAQTEAAIKTIVDGSTGGGNGSPGTTLTLTPAVDPDVFTPTVATNKTTGGDDTINGFVSGHWSSNDIIDGGAGTDTLNAKVGATAVAGALVSVEKVNLTSDNDAASVSLINATGVVNVTNAASSKKLAVIDIDKSVVVGVSGEVGATATSTFTYKANSFTTATDNVNISLVKANAALAAQEVKVVAAGAETIDSVSISVNGSSAVGKLTVANAKSVNIAGSGDLVLDAVVGTASSLTDATKIDASGLTGGVTYTASKGITFTGGKGSDVIKLTAAANADTIIYTSGNVSTKAQADTVSAFTVADDKIDVKAFAFAGVIQKLGSFTGLVEGTSFVNNVGEKVAGSVYFDGTNTFVAFDSNNDGKYNEATDLVVKLAGNVAFTATNVVWA